MNEMLRYTIIRVILFVMGGFLVLGCSDEDDVGNSGGTSKYGLIRMAEEDYDSSNTSYILQDEETGRGSFRFVAAKIQGE